jgi:hypothetical protein
MVGNVRRNISMSKTGVGVSNGTKVGWGHLAKQFDRVCTNKERVQATL